MQNIGGMRFENVDELFRNREYIRYNYSKLDRDTKEMYKWYFFYQLCVVRSNDLKGALWTYVNSESKNSEDNKQVMIEYSKFCNRRSKIRKKEINEDIANLT